MHDKIPAPALPKPAPGFFWNPFVQIFFTVLMTAAAQILLKVGADHSSAGDDSWWSWLGLSELKSGITWLGILAFVASFGGWLYALRFLPLGLAFALTNGVHIFVPLGSWYFLGDHIGLLRGSGICIIIVGILLLGAIGGGGGGESMSLLAWTLIVISQVALVAGQIYLKRAMSRRELPDNAGWIGQLVLGIATMTVWFLLWLGVMPHVELSKQMPLEGISPLLIVLGRSGFSRRAAQLARLGGRVPDVCGRGAGFSELDRPCRARSV